VHLVRALSSVRVKAGGLRSLSTVPTCLTRAKSEEAALDDTHHRGCMLHVAPLLSSHVNYSEPYCVLRATTWHQI
jgi:hypothetical protein